MKKTIYALILPLVVVSGLVFANRDSKIDTTQKPAANTLGAAAAKTEREQWEATAEGIKFRTWQASPEGIKVLDGAAKIREQLSSYSNMEAVITSLTLPPGSRLGFGIMASINGTEYILQFDADKPQLEQLRTLRVNDKIIIRSHFVSYAPKYAYPIISGDYVEKDNKLIFKRNPRKGGC
ncbi:hypothetical protein I5907_17740 [Panacibacter sp. DH6]|uniref:Uncharacterized protein n=1 Tax=Panacibacter microcysteis TaxID=2793269 RepID=A0A931ME51_9BACT|nr:hypothetical protein [Panacibacter microcysteis]MBG9378084.1 hypothetical protein [Panacibacter microcysteis]